MPFEQINRETKRWTFVTELRYAVLRIPEGVAGRLKLPPSLTSALGWEDGMRLNILKGTGEDAGWFALTPGADKARAKVRVQANGVARYTSSLLVNEGVTEAKKTFSPEARIDGQTLYVKLAD